MEVRIRSTTGGITTWLQICADSYGRAYIDLWDESWPLLEDVLSIGDWWISLFISLLPGPILPM